MAGCGVGEMAALAKVLPLKEVDLARPWHQEVFMSDASEQGGAVVRCLCSEEEAREEGRWAPRGGWTVYSGDAEELERRRAGLGAAGLLGGCCWTGGGGKQRGGRPAEGAI